MVGGARHVHSACMELFYVGHQASRCSRDRVDTYRLVHVNASQIPRDVAIDKAVKRIFGIKRRHHKVVEALEGGASEEQHIATPEGKRRDVLRAAEEAESKYGFVIDKTNPTEPGPVVVLKH